MFPRFSSPFFRVIPVMDALLLVVVVVAVRPFVGFIMQPRCSCGRLDQARITVPGDAALSLAPFFSHLKSTRHLERGREHTGAHACPCVFFCWRRKTRGRMRRASGTVKRVETAVFSFSAFFSPRHTPPPVQRLASISTHTCTKIEEREIVVRSFST